jgi:hypothetical protein
MFIEFKNPMQEREQILKELEELQIECVKEYLESKLYAITTKEVVNDIVEGFVQVNSEEFMQNIVENIMEVKNDNKLLRQEMEALKMGHTKEFEEIKSKIVEEYRAISE